MKKMNYSRTGIAAALLGAAVLASGCSAGAQAPVSMPGTIQIENVENSNVITVTGSEAVKVVPDMAEITCSVCSRGDSAAACQETNSKDLEAALAVLKELGIAETSIQTSSYGMQPIRNWNSDTQEITGYEMTTTLTVSDIPLNQAGTVMSKTIASGVNSIDNVSYFSSTYDASYQEALKGAVAMAQAKAEAIAAASQKTISTVIHVEEQGYNPSARYTNANLRASKMAGAASEEIMADMAVMPGEISVEASVTADFAISE